MRTLRSKTAVRKLKKEFAQEHPPTRQIAFLMQDWTDPYNVGAMFRVADALGASELIMTGDTPEPSEPSVQTSRFEPSRPDPRPSTLSPRTKTKGWQERVVGRAQIAVTSMGAHRRVPWRKIKDHEEAALKLKEEGWTLIAVEIAEGAVPYTEFEYPEKLCLVLGQEQRGMYDKVLRHCTAAVYIPMAGKGRSLNLTHAGAVVGFFVKDCR